MRIEDQTIYSWLDCVTEQCSEIDEVWLIGSRANNSVRADSDWDFIAFGSEETISYLRHRQELHRDDVDLLVVYNGNHFRKPWGDQEKAGSLADWRWRLVAEGQAQYEGVKWRDAEDGAGFICSERLAIRVMKRGLVRCYVAD